MSCILEYQAPASPLNGHSPTQVISARYHHTCLERNDSAHSSGLCPDGSPHIVAIYIAAPQSTVQREFPELAADTPGAAFLAPGVCSVS